MRYYVVACTSFIFISSFGLCAGIDISSKLDFDSPRSSSKLVDSGIRYKHVPHATKTSQDNENVKVTCSSSEGCNVTQTQTTESKDSIETDVVVHVKTNVVTNNDNKSAVLDDIPDVPVVVGTSGHTKEDLTPPVFITNPDDRLLPIEQVPSALTSTNTREFIPSVINTDAFNQADPFAEQRININSDSLNSDSLATKENTFRASVLEVQVPHFEPSYHRHYFGENPPPQVLWYQKPDFKFKPTAKPQFWSATTPHYHAGSGVTCTCKNEVPRGLQWYPRKRVGGTHIDDKLAPLN